VSGNDVNYKDTDYDDGDGEVYDAGTDTDGDEEVEQQKGSWPGGERDGRMNSYQDEVESERAEGEKTVDENSNQGFHNGKSEQETLNRLLDHDLDLISNKPEEQELQDGSDYGTDDHINDEKFSEYDDTNPDYSDDLSNMEYLNSLGVKRKLLHSHPNKNIKGKQWRINGLHHRKDRPNFKGNTGNSVASHSNLKKPLVFVEARQPSGQENENLVMSELEKIEDELSDMKSQPKSGNAFVQHTTQKPSSTNNKSSNLMGEAKGDNNKESIVDILANLKDIGKPKQTTNKTGKQNVVKNDDSKLILDELNEIKKQIGNISKSTGDSAKAKISPKVDDIGGEISELLGEDWDLDKRSHIPKPNVELTGGGFGPGFRDPRLRKIGTENDNEGRVKD
jgi:hypothetical protein